MADYMETIGNALSSIGSGAMNALNSTASWLQDPKNQQLISSMYAPWQQNANLATQGQMLSTQNQLASMQFQQAQEQQRMSDAMAQSALNIQVPGASQTRTIPGQTIPGAPIGPQASPNSLGNIQPGGGALKPGIGTPSGGIIEPAQGLPQGPPPTPQNTAATSLMENMRAAQVQPQIPPQAQTLAAPAVQAPGNMPDIQTPDTTETIPGEPTNPFLDWTRAHGIPDTDVQKNPGFFYRMQQAEVAQENATAQEQWKIIGPLAENMIKNGDSKGLDQLYNNIKANPTRYPGLNRMLAPIDGISVSGKGKADLNITVTPEMIAQFKDIASNPEILSAVENMVPGKKYKIKEEMGKITEVEEQKAPSENAYQMSKEQVEDRKKARGDNSPATADEIQAQMDKNKANTTTIIKNITTGITEKSAEKKENYKEKVATGKAYNLAKDIESGKIPPTALDGFGMAKYKPDALHQLAVDGYDFTAAGLDYKATVKNITSLNSTQQLRLRQAINFTSDSLDVIDQMNEAWQGGGFPLLNRGSLLASKQGIDNVTFDKPIKISIPDKNGKPTKPVIIKDKQTLASLLDAQIQDLQSELGTVYKGGNTSTDESLKKAAQNLKGEWSYETLKSGLDLARTNLALRRNSMAATGVAGLSKSASSKDNTDRAIIETRKTSDGREIYKHADGTIDFNKD